AREAPIQAVVYLSGSVEARTNALVASEVSGLVAELRAREGTFVNRGDILVRLRNETRERDREAAEAQLAEAQARLELAQRALVRSSDLRDSGVISQQTLDDAETEVGAWQGRADQAKALIARLTTQIEDSVVRAPFAGVVVREHCALGEWVDTGGPVVEMVDPRHLEVVVNVPERHFAAARMGAAARVLFESLPDLDVEGQITAIIPLADPQSRSFPVKIRIDNPDGRIGVGMSASVAFPGGEERQATVVPKDAIVSQGAQRLVYRVEDGPPGEDGTTSPVAAVVPVTLGAGSGEWIEVDAVAPGDLVVTRGNERLAPGAQLITETVEYAQP
ncbi:MAG: efflux RND transporter periplasmic adaptor subunit, partial [Acidobacteriota bacterium]|nr:efflux RND transporter periplasmic adaptor subunit [Acidobacteriota bacterium]